MLLILLENLLNAFSGVCVAGVQASHLNLTLVVSCEHLMPRTKRISNLLLVFIIYLLLWLSKYCCFSIFPNPRIYFLLSYFIFIFIILIADFLILAGVSKEGDTIKIEVRHYHGYGSCGRIGHVRIHPETETIYSLEVQLLEQLKEVCTLFLYFLC